MKYLILTFLLLSACAPGSKGQSSLSVLVIGDSISLGWYPKLQTLHPDLSIVHAPGNSMNSRNGATNVSSWLGSSNFDVVFFNHGIWDSTPASGKDAPYLFTSREEYESNLKVEAIAIKAQTRCPIFILTTSTPMTQWLDDEIKARNEIATRVMSELGVPVIDLYTQSIGAEHITPTNIHFSEAGSQKLAEFIDMETLAMACFK